MAAPASRTLLLPVDTSEHSLAKETVEWVAKTLVREGDVVLLLNVIPSTKPQLTPSFGMGTDALLVDTRDESYIRDETKKSEAYMQLLAPLLSGAEVKTAVIALATDPTSVGHAIIAHADKASAAIIVVMRTGKSRLREAVVGSTTELLVHRSRVPVLVLPPHIS